MTTSSPIQAGVTGSRVRPWTYEEFERLGGLGFFRNQRVELLAGRIIKMAPQLDAHAAAIGLVQRAIEKAFPGNFWVRLQLPLQIGRWSGPEPDISVVPGSPRDYVGTGHPKTALLVVEISDTTLRLDRGKKAALYAKAGIADYWILNLVERELEVHRAPIADASNRFGHRYSELASFAPSASVLPLVATTQIAIADMLP